MYVIVFPPGWFAMARSDAHVVSRPSLGMPGLFLLAQAVRNDKVLADRTRCGEGDVPDGPGSRFSAPVGVQAEAVGYAWNGAGTYGMAPWNLN